MDFRQGISEVFLSVGEEKKNKLVLEYGFFSDLLKAHKTYLTCQKKDKHWDSIWSCLKEIQMGEIFKKNNIKHPSTVMNNNVKPGQLHLAFRWLYSAGLLNSSKWMEHDGMHYPICQSKFHISVQLKWDNVSSMVVAYHQQASCTHDTIL